MASRLQTLRSSVACGGQQMNRSQRELAALVVTVLFFCGMAWAPMSTLAAVLFWASAMYILLVGRR